MKHPDHEHYRHQIVDGKRLECHLIGSPGEDAPTLVFLHEGLGSVALWRDFPDRVCAATGLPGLVYSRAGYGWSDPLPGRRTPNFMHHEALRVLPELLESLRIERPILIGHSDGASIALIHAGTFPQADAAVAVLAPHLFVEPVCVEAIADIARRFESPGLPKLARYHADVEGAFRGWSEVWLSDAFASWTIEKEVAATRCPILAIQGEDDEYGTMRQLERISELRPDARLLKLPDCRHSPHRDRPHAVLDALAKFCREIADREREAARRPTLPH